MPRTVRISPVPIPPPPAEPRPRRRYGGLVGAALLAVAVVLGLGSVLLAGRGDHSFDRNPTPPSTVRLTAGQEYLLSTVDGPAVIQGVAPLTCRYTAADGAAADLAVTAENPDSRATHAVARFVSPVTGTVGIACTGGAVGTRAVFVDDADDAGADLAGWLLLLAVLAGTAGVGLGLGALYRRTTPRPTAPDEPAQVSGVTADPDA